MSHPIPIGRRAALHDPAFWRPLKGLVSTIAEHFKMQAEVAGAMLYEGMSSGEIGHRSAAPGSQTWVVTPRVAELARRAGFSYDEQINWREGTMYLPGGQSQPVEVYWPDVERAAQGKPAGLIIDGNAEQVSRTALAPPPIDDLPRKKPGPKGGDTARAARAMLVDLRDGKQTFSTLHSMKQESLAAMYGVKSRDTAVKALKQAMAMFSVDNDLDK